MKADFFKAHSSSNHDKDICSRLSTYADYLQETEQQWLSPDLDLYKHYLETEKAYAPRTVHSHLNAVRGWYQDISSKPEGIAELIEQSLADQHFALSEVEMSMAVSLIQEAANYQLETPDVPELIHDEFPSQDYLKALYAITIQTPQDLRDLILLALPFFGLTDVEVVGIEAQHISISLEGQVTIEIPSEKASSSRWVTLADDVLFTERWIGFALKKWTETMKISSGPLFYGFYNGGMRQREKPLTSRGLKKIIRQHAIRAATKSDEDQLHTLTDMRRAGARRLYLAGLEVDDIRNMLGFTTLASVMSYVGPPKPLTEEPIDSVGIIDQLSSLRLQRI